MEDAVPALAQIAPALWGSEEAGYQGGSSGAGLVSPLKLQASVAGAFLSWLPYQLWEEAAMYLAGCLAPETGLDAQPP